MPQPPRPPPSPPSKRTAPPTRLAPPPTAPPPAAALCTPQRAVEVPQWRAECAELMRKAMCVGVNHWRWSRQELWECAEAMSLEPTAVGALEWAPAGGWASAGGEAARQTHQDPRQIGRGNLKTKQRKTRTTRPVAVRRSLGHRTLTLTVRWHNRGSAKGLTAAWERGRAVAFPHRSHLLQTCWPRAPRRVGQTKKGSATNCCGDHLHWKGEWAPKEGEGSGATAPQPRGQTTHPS